MPPAVPTPKSPALWFDAHLDLAYLAVNGRDMLAPLERVNAQSNDVSIKKPLHPPASVTLPALADGRVRLMLATIFTEPNGTGPEGYPSGDADRAFAVGRAQLEVYLTWRDRGLIALDLATALRIDSAVGQVRGGMGVAEVVPETLERRIARLEREGLIHTGILVENADPIRSPDDLAWWQDRGVVAIGLAWAKASRYAAGNGTPREEDCGVTEIGRSFVREMDRLGIVHDLAHLSDRAMTDLLSITDRPVIASHSNSRVLQGDPANQRHLTDDAIRETARRGGIIGLNLFSAFLVPGLTPQKPGRATIDDCLRHVEHVCEVIGSRRHVGLGSDMDGGFGANVLPEGINSPRDLSRLSEALHGRGWSDEEVAGFCWKNWARCWSQRTES